MKVIALGTGTSLGIPLIGCTCQACISTDPRDKRLRCSIYIELLNKKVLIDVSPDFRQQFLTNHLKTVDYVLFTHEHNDHVGGIDDLRAINFFMKKNIPLYGESRVLKSLKDRYHYAFGNYPGAPKIFLNEISHTLPFNLDDIQVIPIRVIHGKLPILGFRINDFAYITDASHIDEQELDKLKNIDTLIINALRHESHFSHFTLKESLSAIELIKPRQAFLTHISHNMGPTQDWSKALPPHVKPLNDNMVISI